MGEESENESEAEGEGAQSQRTTLNSPIITKSGAEQQK
jgi:hypothetical protein